MSGKVYLAGAGPGMPDLVTVRTLRLLEDADVIIYDYLVNKRLLASAKEGAELVCCDRLGKKRHTDGFSDSQDKISQLLVRKAKEGKRVVRLKSGDPSIFARSTQELETLVRNKIDFEIVPGITAAHAASSFTGIVLTDRRMASSVAFITGHEDPNKKKSLLDWKSLAKERTLVFYMAVGNLKRITGALCKAGKSAATPVAIVQEVSLPTQKVVSGTLTTIAKKAEQANIRPPAVVIIGEVAKFEKKFNWLKKEKRVLFTGLSAERFFQKKRYFHVPMIEIVPMDDYREFDRIVLGIGNFDWIIFASRYSVEYFFRRLDAVGLDARALNAVMIAAIGESTKKKLRDFAIAADLVPKKESSDGLVEAFKKIDVKNRKIFMPRSDLSDKGLTLAFERYGAQVTTGFAYRNVMPDDLPDIDLNFFNEIMFTSPSTVRNFVKRYGPPPKKVKVRCIGDVTKKEARRCRLLD